MAKMVNAPANSEHHEMFLQGLKENLDLAHYKLHQVHPAPDATLEPGLALKLANEIRGASGTKPKLSVYPLHKMRTETDVMSGGSTTDDGTVTVVDGKLQAKKKDHVNLGDLHAVEKRIMVFMTTLSWATSGHSQDGCWSARADQVVRQTLNTLIWQQFAGRYQAIGHIIQCWKQTLMYLGEKLQNGSTLAEAWANSSQWEASGP